MILRELLGFTFRSSQSLAEAFTNVLFPQYCLLSGVYLSPLQPTLLPGISNSALMACAPAPDSLDLMLLVQQHLDADDIALSAFHSLWKVGTDSVIDNAIYAIKYSERTTLAVALGKHLGTQLSQKLSPFPDVIVGVPVHAARLRERGYNQAELIAQGVRFALHAQHTTHNVLIRNRYTGTQTALSQQQRLANMSAAFRVQKPEVVRGSNILLVDDVLTTGATLNACATALLEAGAKRVEAATICAAV